MKLKNKIKPKTLLLSSILILAIVCGIGNTIVTSASTDATATPGVKDDQALPKSALDPNGDEDGDGATNSVEEYYQTDPLDADSDNDGMLDGYEIYCGPYAGGWQEPNHHNDRFAILIVGGVNKQNNEALELVIIRLMISRNKIAYILSL